MWPATTATDMLAGSRMRATTQEAHHPRRLIESVFFLLLLCGVASCKAPQPDLGAGAEESALAPSADIERATEQSEEIVQAAHAGDLATVTALLDSGVPVNAREPMLGFSSLHAAAGGGHLEVVKALLERGAAVDARAKYSATPLHVASAEGQVEAMAALIAAGADVNATTSGRFWYWLGRPPVRGWTPLHFADAAGSEDGVALLLAHGAGVAAPDRDGFAPLHYAAVEEHDAVVRRLRQRGALEDVFSAAATGDDQALASLLKRTPGLVRAKDSQGGTALWYAALCGSVPCARLLVGAGAEVNAGGPSWSPPLAEATVRRHRDMMRYLLEHGAQVGEATLTAAVRSRDPSILEMLLSARAELPPETLTSVLIHAAECGSGQMAADLLNAGADPNSPVDGQLALGTAALAGNQEVATILLTRGAAVNGQDACGSTALHWGTLAGSVQMARLLLEAGADASLRDSDGRTALDLAMFLTHDSIVELLRPSGVAR